MSDNVIHVENLGKCYRIGAREARHKTFHEAITDTMRSPFRSLSHLRDLTRFHQTDDETVIWALKDINFDVKRGEVIGIIGPNGAGKSTLLKILSRITEPTTGLAEIRGRVSSLLEVGTGFHQELTGRENVYLNATILGMGKKEIAGKFDEIVEFSGVDKFLDTPVKRYSSGMQVRLAFSVAAHLDPDILIVDEVLAVGDAAFQKKCLGKMGEAGQKGRTVIYVSHNMTSIKMLCARALLISGGQITDQGSAETVVNEYLSSSSKTMLCRQWPEATAPGDEYFRLLELEIHQNGVLARDNVSTAAPLEIRVKFIIDKPTTMLQVGFELETVDGMPVFQSFHSDGSNLPLMLEPGVHTLSCQIDAGLLNEGAYVIRPLAALYRSHWILARDPLTELRFQASLDHPRSELWQVARAGALAPFLPWMELSPSKSAGLAEKAT